MFTVKIVGMSHIHALRRALALTPSRCPYAIEFIHFLKLIPEKNFTLGNIEDPEPHPNLQEKLTHLSPEDSFVFSQIGGNAHNFIGLFEHPLPFDVILPEQKNLPLTAGAEIIPYRLFHKTMADIRRTESAIFKATRKTTSTKIYHLESPPPIKDNDFCMANLPPAFSTEKHKKMKIADPFFRYKFWRIHSDTVRQDCLGAGIEFVPCPQASMDQDGFLLPEYYEDPLHGNQLYGGLVLDQIHSIIKETSGIQS